MQILPKNFIGTISLAPNRIKNATIVSELNRKRLFNRIKNIHIRKSIATDKQMYINHN